MESHWKGLPVPTCHQLLDRVLAAGIKRVILYGPPGTGKTYSALNRVLNGKPSYRLVCTEEMTTMDVSGAILPSTDGWQWRDGEATKAWRTGGRLVIDEIDKANGDVFALLLAYTDSMGSASYCLPNGETIYPHPDFSVVMTTNIEDPNDLPPALKDRFPIAIAMDQAHPQALESLPEEFRSIAAEVVAHSDKDKRASLRAFEAFGTLLSAGFQLAEACGLVFNENVAEAVQDAVMVGLVASGADSSTVNDIKDGFTSSDDLPDWEG